MDVFGVDVSVISIVITGVIAVLSYVLGEKFSKGQIKAADFTREVSEALVEMADPVKVLTQMIEMGKASPELISELAKQVTEAGGALKDIVLVVQGKKE